MSRVFSQLDRLDRHVQAAAALLELLGLGFHAGGQRLRLGHAFGGGKVAHFLRDLHRAELGAAHGAEMRHLGRVFGQGFVVVFLGRCGGPAQGDLGVPAALETRLAVSGTKRNSTPAWIVK